MWESEGAVGGFYCHVHDNRCPCTGTRLLYSHFMWGDLAFENFWEFRQFFLTHIDVCESVGGGGQMLWVWLWKRGREKEKRERKNREIWGHQSSSFIYKKYAWIWCIWWMHLCNTYIYIYTCIHIFKHVYMYIYINIYIYAYVHVYVYVDIYVHVSIHIRCTHTHTYTKKERLHKCMVSCAYVHKLIHCYNITLCHAQGVPGFPLI